MKNTSQQYLNSEAHGYLMEAKACKLLLKDLERIRAKLKRHIEKEAADREAEFEAAMQSLSAQEIQRLPQMPRRTPVYHSKNTGLSVPAALPALR